jgi:hypothetical protein
MAEIRPISKKTRNSRENDGASASGTLSRAADQARIISAIPYRDFNRHLPFSDYTV